MPCEKCEKDYTGSSFQSLTLEKTICYSCKEKEVDDMIKIMSENSLKVMRRRIEETLRHHPNILREVLRDFMIHDKINARPKSKLTKNQQALKEASEVVPILNA